MDTRREMIGIRKQLDKYHRNIGEYVLWAAFDPVHSVVDPIYNEPGARAYFAPVFVQTLWINRTEGSKRFDEERFDVRNNISLAISVEALRNAGVPNVFADATRVLDIFKYWENRYWAVTDYEILGRMPQADSSTIGVLAVEIDLVGDYPFENTMSIEDINNP